MPAYMGFACFACMRGWVIVYMITNKGLLELNLMFITESTTRQNLIIRGMSLGLVESTIAPKGHRLIRPLFCKPIRYLYSYSCLC